MEREGEEEEEEQQWDGDGGVEVVRKRTAGELCLISLGSYGVSFVWALEFSLATPYFRYALHASTKLSHRFWILGPLSGLVVAPLVGFFSDRCNSRFGKRRPFILVGTVVVVLSMGMLACAPEIALLLRTGSLNTSRSTDSDVSRTALIVGVFAFGLLDVSLNAVMWPLRALLSDVVLDSEQHPVQAAAAVLAAAAEISASVLVAMIDQPVSRIQAIFAVGGISLVVTILVTLITCNERVLNYESPPFDSEQPLLAGNNSIVPSVSTGPTSSLKRVGSDSALHGPIETSGSQRKDEYEDVRVCLSDSDAFANLSSAGRSFRYQQSRRQIAVSHAAETRLDGLQPAPRWFHPSRLFRLPSEFLAVAVVFALAWFAFFCCMPYFSAWMGASVLGGDPQADPGSESAKLFQRGVGLYSASNAVKASLSLVLSAVYPLLLARFGERILLATAFALFAALLGTAARTTSVIVACSVVALSAVPSVATHTVPLALIAERYPSRRATYLGILNVFSVVPQIIDTLYTGTVAERFGQRAVFAVGSGWALLASLASVAFLPRARRQHSTALNRA